MSIQALSRPRTARSFLLNVVSPQCEHSCNRITCTPHPQSRSFSQSSATALSPSADRRVKQSAGFSSTAGNCSRLGHRAKEKLLDREFFLSLLSSATTKREARQYLARIKDSSSDGNNKAVAAKTKDPVQFVSEPSWPGVELGSFYGASRSVYNSPVFRLDSTPSPPVEGSPERIHLALVKITTPQLLDDPTVDGVAKTLSQLTRLGLACCVVVDPGAINDAKALRTVSLEQATRISTAIDAQPDSKSLRLDSVLSIAPTDSTPRVLSRKALLRPLRSGQIVIVTPIAYTEDSPKAVCLPADDAVLALTKEFAGLATVSYPDEEPLVSAQRIDGLQKEVSLDRLILLDPLGGIPAFSGPQGSHVFINMEQEFDNIQDELLEVMQSVTSGTESPSVREKIAAVLPSYDSNSSSNGASPAPLSPERVLEGYLGNLRLSRNTLALLPTTSSGIITSPADVATSAKSSQDIPGPSAVGTRRLRNPLIHNLLTDKSLHSPSLPLSRRAATGGSQNFQTSQFAYPTTFVKRGMPLTIFPDPRLEPWTAQNRPKLNLNDSSIDLSRLVHLIEDSFNRKLDVKHYLDRVNGRLAGLIVAGEYEGGAILTWEMPPGVIDDGSEASTARLVPYLDKFAVLKRSQGAGGVADIVFNAMVRACFPNGVCWRSRKDNPVNKWYFERSQGSWKLPDSNWTMFWTTSGLPDNAQMFQDYEAVCRSIQPSWADKKDVLE